MSEEKIIEKDDWKTILGELDEIVRETGAFSSMIQGDKSAFEEEEFPALIHFIKDIKKEKKNQSWEKIENFSSLAKENLKLLEETQQIKMQDKLIDRSFIGVLPKNTAEIGKNAMVILNEIPLILKTINESIEAMLIDIKLKLGFPIIKFEKEILDLKHQITLIEDEIQNYTNTKKGFASKEEQFVYTQAYREKYHEIIEKAKEYVIRDFNVHSKAFEDVYERFQTKINNYKESPAYDDFIKENCTEITKCINTWPKDGFKAFTDALKYIRKIDDRLSDTRQTYIQQIKSDLDKDINEMITKIESLQSLEGIIKPDEFFKMKESSEKIVSSIKFLLKTVDVVAEDPKQKLANDEKILLNAKEMATAAFNGTYGSVEEKINTYIKQVALSKNTKKIIDEINETKSNCLEPSTLYDVIDSLSFIIDFNKNMDLLKKEIAVDIVDTQEKYIKKIKNINKFLGDIEVVKVPSSEEIVKIDKVDFDDFAPLKKISELLKGSLAQAAKAIADFEVKFSEGLGISINPNLESKIDRYKRPSYKPTIKQANKAMKDLENLAKDLAKDTAEAINNYVKQLKNFQVKTNSLKSFQELLKRIAKDSAGGKISLTNITTRLQQAVIEYAKLLEKELSDNKEELETLFPDSSKINIYDRMTLENFDLKHNELVNLISLENITPKKEETTELRCKKCNAEIVWKREDYNDMLGLDVLSVRCKNGHEDTIIGFGAEEQKEEIVELKCSKCESEVLVPVGIDIFSKNALTITVACPKNHETTITLKEK